MNSTYTSTIYQNIHQDNQQESSSNTSQIHKPNTINPYIKPCAKPHCYVASSMYHVMTKCNHQNMNINIHVTL
jgi:hypothetical protein